MVTTIAISSAKGKSSGSRSKVLDGCTRVKCRSKPCARARQVDSRLAGELSIPAKSVRECHESRAVGLQ